MLHGMGDTEAPFTTLARRMELPDTAALCIRAPFILPVEFSAGLQSHAVPRFPLPLYPSY